MHIKLKPWLLYSCLFIFSLFSMAWAEDEPNGLNQEQDEIALWEQEHLLGAWGGKRAALDDEGLSLGLVFTGDVVTNHSGGLKTGTKYLGNIDLTAALDTEKAGLWKDGTFFVYILNNHGAAPSGSNIGDLQVVSNIEATETTRLYEMWYEHHFDWSGVFSILIGQHDLNSEFNVTEYGGLFINSSFGIEPDVSVNVPVSIFPVAAPAARVKWEPTESIYFMAAVYDGDPGAPDVNKSGLRWRFSSDEGAMSIYEAGYHFGEMENSRSLPGSYKLGFWYHTDSFDDVFSVDIDGNPLKHTGNYGAYFLADQMLVPFEGAGGLGAFIQIGGAPEDRNMVDFYIGGGLHCRGLIPGREGDMLGLAAAHASISDKMRRGQTLDSHETTLELTYRAAITPWLALQPDLQVVYNPGADPSLNNAVVSLLRFEVSF